MQMPHYNKILHIYYELKQQQLVTYMDNKHYTTIMILSR